MSEESHIASERKERAEGDQRDPERTLNDRDYSAERQYRKRSRSPDRSERRDKPGRKDAGFKWKERRHDDTERQDRDTGLKRGYRDHYRPRSRSRSPPRPERRRDDHRERHQDSQALKEKEKKKEKRPPPAAPQQEMIIVYVNDRLGTKKAIPCFPTDPIKDFKVIVASMIGRQPHEILLKRQGERPFKDMLTLQDYGVSNNVQLDLEVDTGD